MQTRKLRDENNYHSILNDLNALIIQGIFFNFLLQILEKKNIQKWLRYFDKLALIFKRKKKITEVAETIESSTLDEKEKCAELIKGEISNLDLNTKLIIFKSN